MSITTSPTIIVQHVIPKGSVSTYSASQLSLWVTHNKITTRYGCQVINSQVSVDGLISTSTLNLPLVLDGSYTFEFTSESASDIDTEALIITTIAKKSIIKVTNVTTLFV